MYERLAFGQDLQRSRSCWTKDIADQLHPRRSTRRLFQQRPTLLLCDEVRTHHDRYLRGHLRAARDVLTAIAIAYRFKSHSAFPLDVGSADYGAAAVSL